MDLTKLAGSLLSSDSIGGLSGLTGASDNDVSKVLAKALPALLSGAKDQAKGEGTSQGFATALSDHAKDDTSDLTKFLGKVDMKDGAKIIAHLLGSGKDDVVADIASDTGVSQAKTDSILSGAAPLLMSLLGQQADEDDNKNAGVEALIGALLENVDLVELLTGTSSNNSGKKKSTKKKAAKKKEESSAAGSIVNALFKLLK